MTENVKHFTPNQGEGGLGGTKPQITQVLGTKLLPSVSGTQCTRILRPTVDAKDSMEPWKEFSRTISSLAHRQSRSNKNSVGHVMLFYSF